MPYVIGFLNIVDRGHPSQGLPGHGGQVDPGYGVDAGAEIDNSLPPSISVWPIPLPPPGIWPPPTVANPIVPVPPTAPDQGLPPAGGPPAAPGHPIALPPGAIWPPTDGVPPGKFVVLAGIPGVGWRYVVVDPSLVISPPIAPGAQPKK